MIRKRTAPSVARRLRRFLRRTILWFVTLSIAAVLYLRVAPPLFTPFMLRAKLSAIVAGEALDLSYRWVGWKRISANAALAVVASEDQRFPAHHGFDFKAMQQAVEAGKGGRRMRGASTISQQTAKNLFLWSGRSWIRKGLEAYFTVLLEALLPKRRILELYLNIAEFGPGIYGVEAAAQRFFGKPAEQLSLAEAARLAAVLPNPRRLHVDRPSRYVQTRTAHILRAAGQLGSAYLRRL